MSAPRLTLARWAVVVALLTAGVALLAGLALAVGVEPLDLAEAARPGTLARVILMDVRLPRVVLAGLVGASLGAAGATLQAVLKNPLADPYILGVSGGAALGGTLALTGAVVLATLAAGGGAVAEVAGSVREAVGIWGGVPITVAATLGALGAVAVTFAVARGAGGVHPHSLLLAGVVLNAFATAVILFLRTVITEEKAQELVWWLMGTLGYRPWGELGLAGAAVALGVAFLMAWSHRLNLLAVGDAGAAMLGVDVPRTRLVLVVVSSAMVGVSVSLAGLVGFVGLMVPHILRAVLGPDHRLLVPAAALGGAGFLVASDLVARLGFLLVGTELPVGVVTAFTGGPFFLWLMRRNPMGGAV